MDIRSHGKEFDRFYEAPRQGVRFVRRGRIPSTRQGQLRRHPALHHEDGAWRSRTSICGALHRIGATADAQRLAELFALSWITTGLPRLRTLNRFRPAAAGFSWPAPSKLQSDTAVGGRGLHRACEAAVALMPSRGELTRQKTYPAERSLAGDEVRIGVFVCSCASTSRIINVDESPSMPERCPTWCWPKTTSLAARPTRKNSWPRNQRESPEPHCDRGVHTPDPRASLPGHPHGVGAEPLPGRNGNIRNQTPGFTSVSRREPRPRPRTRCAWPWPRPPERAHPARQGQRGAEALVIGAGWPECTRR